MVALHIIPAAKRLTRTEFSRRGEHVDHQVDLGFYTCPHCVFRLQFQTSDLERHETSPPRSNLQPPWDQAMDRARPVCPRRWEFFLDFECPGCGAPVRIVYETTGEWQMGSHGWRLLDVVEAVRWATRSR